VRQLEVWGGPDEHEADSLGPCILCARARHGLAPRCPECNDPAAVLEELQLTDDRGLRCSRCHRQFWSTPRTREAILEATLRRDPACRGCPLEHSPVAADCLRSAVFLNFFRNRVLLLERLDLDLEDYLRWRRDPGASGTRQTARQAFDVHRLLVENRRDQLPSLTVAKVSDLLSAADLFADIVTGVEHLHHHGVAHLDLKPANVCVRYRGPDLDVKIIDLGLSDDPHTLAYLRQAEGPLSLWTDYSAPEFRRTRARPIGVDGRFREDACELDWPCAQTPAAELPCPGDLLLFDDRDLARQPFRVVSTRPVRDGWLVVQAQAEPQHRLWLGVAHSLPPFGPEAQPRTGLAVVLEKHCGFPADIYSLGMLLLAVLVGHPDVSDFREALPGIEIELEETLCEQPRLPGRGLVQKLLSNRSKHLQVFHSYAHRLACYGVAQPLAEELLGIALRATLRGDPRMFYLTDRGADARTALRRLRADLDAVRGALRNALTAAQAAAVREQRLAVLDQLRSRLHDRPAEAGPLTYAEPPARLLYPALDLGAAGDEHCVRELTYLSPLVCQPTSVLGRWERELTGAAEDGAAAGRHHEFLVRYCRRFDLDGAAPAEFLNRYHELTEKVAQRNASADPTLAEDLERVLRWLDDHQALATRLACVPPLVSVVRDFLRVLQDKLLTSWDRALRPRHLLFFRRQAAHVPLSRAERAALRDEEVSVALEKLAGAVRQSSEQRAQQIRAFEHALAQWRNWCSGHAWLEAVVHLEAEALRQRYEVDAHCDAWDRAWSEAAWQLRQCLTRITNLLHAYEPLLTMQAPLDEVSARLTRAQREALDLRTAENAMAWLEQHWPPPSDVVEAILALWELGVSIR
jgi:serine/threonine protein kinase